MAEGSFVSVWPVTVESEEPGFCRVTGVIFTSPNLVDKQVGWLIQRSQLVGVWAKKFHIVTDVDMESVIHAIQSARNEHTTPSACCTLR